MKIESPLNRTILGNEAVVLTESFPKSPTVSVQLFVSASATPDTPETHGWRHLIEHLAAPGRNRDLDRRIESAGGFLSEIPLREARTNYPIKLISPGTGSTAHYPAAVLERAPVASASWNVWVIVDAPVLYWLMHQLPGLL